MKLEDIKYRVFMPTFDEMVKTVHEALLGNFPNYLVSPWNKGEIPTIEEVALVFQHKGLELIKYYLPACILLEREVPKKFKDAIERLVDPEAYSKRLNETERQLLMSFELFMSTNPTLKEAIQKLIQLTGDYWEKFLTLDLAEKQIKERYPNQKWS